MTEKYRSPTAGTPEAFDDFEMPGPPRQRNGVQTEEYDVYNYNQPPPRLTGASSRKLSRNYAAVEISVSNTLLGSQLPTRGMKD